MNRTELTDQILSAKRTKGLSWKQIAEAVGGGSPVLITAALLGQMRLEKAQVEVDGTVYNPSVGETFGPNHQYRLQSVSGNCATFLYGDESFTLCVTPSE